MQYESEDKVTYELADLGERFLAFLADSILLGIVTGIFVRGGGIGGGILSFLVMLAFYWYFWTRHDGQSPGKMLFRLRVIKANGMPITDADAIVRVIGYWVNSLPFLFGLPWLWAIWDSRKQGWHDKLAATYVVKAGTEKRKREVVIETPDKPKRYNV